MITARQASTKPATIESRLSETKTDTAIIDLCPSNIGERGQQRTTRAAEFVTDHRVKQYTAKLRVELRSATEGLCRAR